MSTKWCTIAPFHYQDVEGHLDLPFDLGNGVVLRPVPDWLKDDRITKNLSYSHREWLVRDIQYAFAVEYEASSLGDPDPDWKGHKPRSKQDRARELIIFANLGLWLARPSFISFEIIVSADQLLDSWGLRQLSVVPSLKPLGRYSDATVKMGDLELARELFSALTRVPRTGAVSITVGILWKALLEESWEVRYLLLWVALEALFGPEDPREITYRMSQRIAFFLATDRKSARKLFNSVKTGYGWRSRLVHGMRLSKPKDTDFEALMYDTEGLVRESLNRILRHPKLIQIFSGKGRERYLDDSVFSF